MRIDKSGWSRNLSAVSPNMPEVRQNLSAVRSNMPSDSPKKKLRIGDILVNHGYITEEELQQALIHQKESYQRTPLGQICVDLGFISSVDLSKILRKHCKHIYLGELLVNLGIINNEQLEQVLNKQKGEKKRIGELLLESGFLTEEQLARSLSMQLGFPFIVPSMQIIDQKLALRFHEAFLRRQEAIPAFEKEGIVTLIMTDPLADDIIDDFKRSLNAEIEPAIATRSAIHSLLDTLSHKIEYGQKESEEFLAGKDLVIGNEPYTRDARDNTVNIVNYIISSAITEGASDIHIEPQMYNLRVRFRIDGVLQHKTDLPKRMIPSVISRIKVMCGMDIAEHRKHQDGRIEARILDNDIDLRVSAYSAVHGENIVIRILKRQTTLIDLDKLGFSPINLKRYRQVLDSPTGIILVCGPTGSGKTTTLYASLNYLNSLARKIITVEDPVEYTMEGVVQGQLNTRIGLSYLDFIASMMRQDPDVIMVGEIRDNAAAAATIQAALTGHKALSTFHTEDSTGALLRLIDMGIETFLISSTIVSVVAQRLVRRVCTHCSERYEPDPVLFQNLGIKNVEPGKYLFSRGRGCNLCNQTGYRGRIGIHELLVLNDSIRDAVLSRKISSEIRQIARYSARMISMREDGFFKAAQGITNIEEVLRVLFYGGDDADYSRDAEEVIRQINGENIGSRSQEPEVRSQKSEGRSQESGVRSQESEVRSQKAGVRSQKSEVRSQERVVRKDDGDGLLLNSTPLPLVGENTLSPLPSGTEKGSGISEHSAGEECSEEPSSSQLYQNGEAIQECKVPEFSGEVYRVRFEADTVSLEQNRIRDLFRRYQSLKQEFGEDISEDLLADFIDFIVYYTSLAQKRYGAVFVEFILKVIEGRCPRIFIQFQSCESARSAFSSHLERARGQRFMEFMA
ncbi:MAG: ATPase, T2SS/T4P/T4SS family [bacterium]